MTDGPLPLSDRVALMMVRTVTRMLQGYEALFLEELFRTHGARTFMKWASVMGDIIETTERDYGHANAHLIISFSALWAGCDYCGRGHLLASNMARFQDEGVLFPLDERQVPALQNMRDDDALLHLNTLLADPRWELERALIRRLYDLRADLAVGTTPHDEHLRAALAAWEWLTDCSIVSQGVPDEQVEPLSKIARKKATLLPRYRAARDAAS